MPTQIFLIFYLVTLSILYHFTPCILPLHQHLYFPPSNMPGDGTCPSLIARFKVYHFNQQLDTDDSISAHVCVSITLLHICDLAHWHWGRVRKWMNYPTVNWSADWDITSYFHISLYPSLCQREYWNRWTHSLWWHIPIATVMSLIYHHHEVSGWQ